ncbi:hypothetical protein SLEP1_g3326 [Rubroshorea leprosula]|uniref:NADH dehydrogenase subunit 1 n=1 Tax=Rubroshorea leprosula TaxID=152421 RepID=A0AAV5HT96_9ROSI|nr:hypothetical protein SLEP1_g3326 [Rubroshorea leprosula]
MSDLCKLLCPILCHCFRIFLLFFRIFLLFLTCFYFWIISFMGLWQRIGKL